METELVEAKSAFADRCNVTSSTVSRWISERKIPASALVGSGQRAQVRVAPALKALRLKLDVGQRLGNGAGTRLRMPKPGAEAAPSPPLFEGAEEDPALDAAIKREKLTEIQGRNRKAHAEEEARAGRFVLAEDARREMNALAKRLVAMFEAALTELADDVAARHRSDPRDEMLLLSEAFRVWRTQMVERAQKVAETLPKFTDPNDTTLQETP